MSIDLYTTNQNGVMQKKQLLFQPDKKVEMCLLKVYANERRQKVLGFGGAFTEAAAYTVSKMSPEKQKQILECYFGPTGNRYNFCRTHIQSCDFSLDNYAYVDDPNDRKLESFSLERDEKYIIPFIKAALKKNKEIQFIASPWSPPAFMKTNGEMNNGGALKPEYYDMWASMVTKYVQEYRKLGIVISRLTVQNEPEATQTWDSCRYTAVEERTFACEHLRSVLDRAGLADVKIEIWDHNKEQIYDRALCVLSEQKAREAIAGVAFHWYSGDHFEALQLTHELFPEKELLMTEGCVEYSRFLAADQIKNAEMYAHDIIGDFNAGANAYIDWNLVLDEQGGPNHVSNFCDAPIMCHANEDTLDIKLSYHYIGHFSRFVKPGAQRIVVSRWNDQLETAGFINPDGQKVLVILNRTEHAQEFFIQDGANVCPAEIGGHSIMTACWQ